MPNFAPDLPRVRPGDRAGIDPPAPARAKLLPAERPKLSTARGFVIGLGLAAVIWVIGGGLVLWLL